MFNVGDKVVYPMHGAGTIEGIEEKDICWSYLRFNQVWVDLYKNSLD